MSQQQLKLYDLLVEKYLKSDIDSTNIKTIITQIQKAVKTFSQEANGTILKQYTSAAYSLSDLNMAYFSTLFDDKENLNRIREKTNEVLNKRLGLKEDGSIKQNGFIDKMISDKTIQQSIVNEVRNAVSRGSDIQSLKKSLNKIIVGTQEESGLFEKHYNTFAKDILNTIDNANGKIYADELGLRHAYYSGGLIKTSRSICIKNNGKILSTEQIEALRNDPFIVKMYGDKIDEYNPYETPGGYGCLHKLDWITEDLAKGRTREQNKIATERNNKFKERNGL